MFSITGLKIIALIAMTIDHLGEFIPEMPVYFRWIGRIAAPIFMFCMTQALHHTTNRKKYILRLYLMSTVVAVMNIALYSLIYRVNGSRFCISNNIFGTLFQTAILIVLIENVIQRKKGVVFGCILYLLWNGLFLYHLYMGAIPFNRIDELLLRGPFSTFFIHEGAVWTIALGVSFYFFKKVNWCAWLICGIDTILTIYSIGTRVVLRMRFYGFGWLADILEPIINLLGYDTIRISPVSFWGYYQWMMIFAFPFLYLYNGKYGKGFKKFFYIYYPVHIAVLVLLGNVVFVA